MASPLRRERCEWYHPHTVGAPKRGTRGHDDEECRRLRHDFGGRRLEMSCGTIDRMMGELNFKAQPPAVAKLNNRIDFLAPLCVPQMEDTPRAQSLGVHAQVMDNQRLEEDAKRFQIAKKIVRVHSQQGSCKARIGEVTFGHLHERGLRAHGRRPRRLVLDEEETGGEIMEYVYCLRRWRRVCPTELSNATTDCRRSGRLRYETCVSKQEITEKPWVTAGPDKIWVIVLTHFKQIGFHRFLRVHWVQAKKLRKPTRDEMGGVIRKR